MCVKCKNIPLDIQQCESCEEIICNICHLEIQVYSAKSKDKPLCPNKECQSKSEFKLKPIGTKLTKFAKMMKQKHCCPDNKDKITDMNVFELTEHIQGNCSLKRTCQGCQITFNSVEALEAHIMLACDHAEVECPYCLQSFKRKDYRIHKCFIQECTEYHK